jgi:hypothetical protein
MNIVPLRLDRLCLTVVLASALALGAPARAADPPAAEPEVKVPVEEDEAPPPREKPPRPVPMFDSGKLLATAGVTQVEGAGGSGLVPWALITGYETRDAIGANTHYTFIGLSNYNLHSGGAAIGLYDRVELSYTHLWFDTLSTGKALGLGSGFTFEEDVFGAKVRLIGDAVYDQDSWLPQLALGLQYKRNDSPVILKAVGARASEGADFYLAATKVLLDQSLLLNGTVRFTRANQFGILGFGGDRNSGYNPEFEGSIALLLDKRTAVGGDFRSKPDNLGFAKEERAFDLFLAYFFNKNLSATLAYVDLGDIATRRNQDGVYVSLQLGF